MTFQYVKPKHPATGRDSIELNGEFGKIVRELMPGQTFKLIDRDGTEYAVLRQEDLEHLASLAGLRVKEVP